MWNSSLNSPGLRLTITRYDVANTVIKRKPNFSNITLPCNCRVKTSCPLKGKCSEKCIIYKATLASDDNTNHSLAAVKWSFIPVSITTTRCLHISKKAMLPSSQRHFGATKAIKKAPNCLGDRDANHPLPIRGEGLHTGPHREVRNSPIMSHYIDKQENRTHGKMLPY